MASSHRAPNMVKVVTLINFFSGVGGAERLAVEIALRLDRGRFQPVVWTSRPSKGPLMVELEASDVPVHSLARGNRLEVWKWAPFLLYLREERIDVVHAHGFGSNAWATLWGRLAGVPVVIAHEHTWSYEGQALRRLVDRHLIARRADVLLAVSKQDRRRMAEIEGIPFSRTRYLANGIPALAPPSGHDVRAEFGIAEEAPVVGMVSILRSQKGIDILLEAAAILAREFPALRILVAGGGPDRERLEARAGELRLTSMVAFLGLRTDLTDVLAAIDVAVSSSRFEGTPLAVMEYMAAGKPIVATRVGGVPDLIEDGESGLLVEPGDPEALAAGLATLLRDPDRAGRLGRRARERQLARFGIEVMIEQLELLYDTLLAAKRSGS